VKRPRAAGVYPDVRPNDDLSCSCSQCNGARRPSAPVPPIVKVLRGVAARIAGELPRKPPQTLPEAFLW
jgi:hypothetical protein